MDKVKLREIAKVLAEQKEIDKKVIEFIFNKFNKDELKLLLNYLGKEIIENKVYLRADTEDKEIIKEVGEMFKGKEVVFEKDQTLGGGIIVKYKDDIIDLSMLGYVNQVANTLKENI